MNKDLLQALMKWPKPYICSTDLRIILGKTNDARQAIIRRAIKAGLLERVKAGLFVIQEIPGKPLLDRFELAELIYGPSHISFESSLSFHGWIPEAVHTTSSATLKPSKKMMTSVGVFSYEKIPEQIFSVGIAHHGGPEASYFVAEPWKAVADLIYTRKKSWQDLSSFMEDMRVEAESVHAGSLELLEYLASSYTNKRTQGVLMALIKDLTKK